MVDDGSAGDTRTQVTAEKMPYRLQYLRQTHRGPAAARNRAIERATGRYLLFLNDDAMLEPHALALHRAAHEKRRGQRIAVLGRVTLPPAITETPLGHALEHSKLLFQFAQMKGGGKYNFHCFYTCNLSVPRRAVLAAGAFDENFTGPAGEDIELGWRLYQRGYRVWYEPRCVAWHQHRMTPAEFCRLHRRRGEGAITLRLRQPGIRWGGELTMAGLQSRLAWLQAEFPAANEARRLLTEVGTVAIDDPDVRVAVADRLLPLLQFLQRLYETRGMLANPRLTEAIALGRNRCRKVTGRRHPRESSSLSRGAH